MFWKKLALVKKHISPAQLQLNTKLYVFITIGIPNPTRVEPRHQQVSYEVPIPNFSHHLIPHNISNIGRDIIAHKTVSLLYALCTILDHRVA